MTVCLRQSEAGTLKKGFFYSVHISHEKAPGETDEWIVSQSPYPYDECMHAEAPGIERAKLFDCPVNRTHATDQRLKAASLAVSHGAKIPPLTPCLDIPLANEELQQQISTSGLRGVKFSKCEISANDTFVRNPKLYLICPQGKKFGRMLEFDPPSENRCPFCHFEPISCPACGYYRAICSACNRRWLVPAADHKGKDDNRAKLGPWPKDSSILEGKRWDGADFRGYSDWLIMTWRALDFLLSVHAGPLRAEPLRVAVDGMSKKQIEWLEAAKKPIQKEGNLRNSNQK